MKKIHWIQHVEFENLGYIQKWADQNEILTSVTRLWCNSRFPTIHPYDLLVITGGSMSTNDTGRYPWLNEEKRFIKNAIENNKPILGICLGAQILADVLGADVSTNKHKEIGWFPVKQVPNTKDKLKSKIQSLLPEEFMAFHWHGETFNIPIEAEHIFESDACTNQGFIYKDNVIGLQFHLESTEVSINALINNCSTELVDDEYIQKGVHQLVDLNNIITSNKLVKTIIQDLLK
jgi:GMP synthase-like glutamine amidotransferase